MHELKFFFRTPEPSTYKISIFMSLVTLPTILKVFMQYRSHISVTVYSNEICHEFASGLPDIFVP